MFSQSVQKAFEGLRRVLDDLATNAPRIEAAISAMDAEISRALVEDDDKSPMSRVVAYGTTIWVQHGWFPSMWNTGIDLIARTANALGTDRHQNAESAIAAHFESESVKLMDEILRSCPDRQAIISDAFDAHKSGRYSLSIPVFLTQADGIGARFFGIESIYTISDSNFGRIRTKFDEQEPLLGIRYLYFLVGTLSPLNASRKKRERYTSPFNRHTVIHGESTDYGTKVNSLKAISWLHFVYELAWAESSETDRSL